MMEHGGGGVAPTRLGPYRLGRVLGVGGMGEVYEAYDTRLRRHVAMKRIRPDRLATSDESADPETQLRRFRREAELVARLNHPAIVQLHDLMESEDGDWLVMERVDGMSISDLLRLHGPMDETRVRRLGRQLAEGLAAAHARGIVHRDLKASNVLVADATDGGEQAKILDFGVAKKLRSLWSLSGELSGDRTGPAGELPPGMEESSLELTTIGGIVGTYRSMSPEQSRGRKVDQRSDLFSLGVLLYEMATGSSPFRADTLDETLERVRTYRQRPLVEAAPGVSEGFSAMVDELLEKDPAHRPVSALGVAARLAAAGGGPSAELLEESTVGDTSSPGESRGPGGGSLRYWLPALGLLLVLLLVLGECFGPSLMQRGGEAPGSGEPDAFGVPQRTYVALVPPAGALGQDLKDDPAFRQTVSYSLEALRSSLLETLLTVDGLGVVTDDAYDTADLWAESRSDALDVARRLAADEVVISGMHCSGRGGDRPICRISLRRLAASDSRILWADSFQVPPDEPFLMASVVVAKIQSAFPGVDIRTDQIRSTLDAEAYSRFLELRYEASQGGRPGEILTRLEALRQEWPSVASLYLFDAKVRYREYFYSRDRSELARVLQMLRAAHQLAPSDPEPLFRLARVAVEEGRLNLARDAIEALEALLPGDARVGVQRALYLEKRGDLVQARREMKRSVELRSSVSVLLESAGLDDRTGHGEAAAESLRLAIERAPQDRDVRSFLARLDLLAGRLASAETHYRWILEKTPNAISAQANLGLVQMLRGDHHAAAESFEQVLERIPGNPQVLLNLADVHELLGRPAEAQALYEMVVDQTEEDEESAGERAGATEWQRLTTRAQALAHLDHRFQAAEAIQQALALQPNQPQVAFEAALVYSLLGESSSALAALGRARGAFGPAWFELPWFDAVRQTEEFRSLLESDP